jgi:hypothetical protein
MRIHPELDLGSSIGGTRCMIFRFWFETKNFETVVDITNPQIVGREKWNELYIAIENTENYTLTFSTGFIDAFIECDKNDGVVLFGCWTTSPSARTHITVRVNLSESRQELLDCLSFFLYDEKTNDFWEPGG